MPRTISTMPDYSIRWWGANGSVPPERDAFEVLRRMCEFRLSNASPELRGTVRMKDARKAAQAFPKLWGNVRLIVTSPPYLDTTNYQEDQWLRLWFLGGPPRPIRHTGSDDRRRSNEKYWKFLAEAWSGCERLLASRSVLVVRIGGTTLRKEQLFSGVRTSLRSALEGFGVRPIHSGVTTEIRNRQTNAFRPGTKSRRFEHDFAFELKRR